MTMAAYHNIEEIDGFFEDLAYVDPAKIPKMFTVTRREDATLLVCVSGGADDGDEVVGWDSYISGDVGPKLRAELIELARWASAERKAAENAKERTMEEKRAAVLAKAERDAAELQEARRG